MKDLEADLQLAQAHVREVEQFIADQRGRIEEQRQKGSSTDSEERLLAALLKSHDLLVKHLAHIVRLRLLSKDDQ